MKILQSTPLTIVDQTDSRKLEVYIKSNLPTVQIRNSNSGVYTPDWREGEKLILTADVFLDSRIMDSAGYNQTLIKWYKNEISDSTEITNNKNSKTLQITTNELATTPIITYICEATYQSITASMRMTFVRVDTGRDGERGADGTGVRILGTAKSADAVPDTNYYTIVYDTGAIAAAELGDAYVLKSVGHEYDGHLFVCALLNGDENGLDYFIDAGRIQGETGEPAKSIALIGSSQVFRIAKDRTTITPRYITVVAHTINIDDKSRLVWEYRYNATGQWTIIEGKTLEDTNGNTIISINDINNMASVDGRYVGDDVSSISLRTTFKNEQNVIVAEDALTLYKVYDGIDGNKGDTASIAFLTNENISFSANANGQIDTTPITIHVAAYDGSNKVMPKIGTIRDIPEGMSISVDDTSLASLSKEVILTLSISANSNLGSPNSNHGVITIPVITPVDTALQLSWSKINAGPEGKTGNGINNIRIEYGESKDLDIEPEDISWSNSVPIAKDGWYLWTKTVIDYTNPDKDDVVTYTYVKHGDKGDTGTSVRKANIRYAAGADAMTPPVTGWSSVVVTTSVEKQYLWTETVFEFSDGTKGEPIYNVAKQGRGILNVTENYLASASSSGITTSTSGWTTTIQTIDASKRYLWNYEIITYTDNTTSTTSPVIIGVFGNTGATGKGIKSITEYYLASSLAEGITTSTTGWQTSMQPLSEIDKYLWNYELITYTDNTTATINPVIIGAYGDRGYTGAPGDAAVTFQVYSNNGYALSTEVPTILLQTFAYFGDIEIKAGATFQWYRHNGTDWIAISGATNAYFNVSRDDVSFSNNYMCKMQFNGTEYVGVVTIEDKNDEHRVFAAKPSNYFAGDLWVVGTDYIPSGFVTGTMLRAEHTNTSYIDSDWVLATRYDKEIDYLKDTVGTYEQYFSVNSSTGLKVGDASINNNVLTVDRVDTTTINAKEIKVESPLTVSGRYSGNTMLQAPVLNLGNFSLVIESNGSLSIVANT